MPLAKVQLMNAPGGPGVIGAVKAGTGISIAADGSISATGGGTVTSVNVSGASTGLTFSGGPITSAGTITLAGVLAIANGGTGATTLTGLQTAVFPAQSGQAGKYLTTDGGVVSWGTVPPGTITGVTAGTGLSGGGTTGTVTLNNTGVTSLAGSNGISASASTGSVTLNFNISSLPALP